MRIGPTTIVHVDRELFDRTPPHDEAAEAAVIGAMIASGGKAIPGVERMISAGDFYSEVNQRLYEAILRGYSRHSGIVDMNLLSGLDAEDRAVLTQYVRTTPGPATIPHFARKIADRAYDRMVIEKCGELIYNVQTRGVDDDTHAMVSETVVAITTPRRGGDGGPATLIATAHQLYDLLEAGGDQTYRTGLRTFDSQIGLPKQGLVVIAGSQGAGKSTLALQFLRAVAIEQRVPTWVFSFEMPPVRIVATWASQTTGRNYHAMLRGYANQDGYEKLMASMESWSGANVRIERGNPTAQEIYNTLAAARNDGFRVALVDYVQNLPASPGMRALSQTDRVQESMRILQRAARELDMLVICVSQLVLSASREHKRPPTMWDIRDSGAIADVADMLIAIWRPGHGVATEDADCAADEGLLCVLKSKYGETANITVRMLAAWMMFKEDETAMR